MTCTLRRLAVLAFILLALVSLSACSDGNGDTNQATTQLDGATGTATAVPEGVCETPPIVSGRAPEENQFENGGFEAGSAPWCSLGTSAWGKPFSVSERQANRGDRSALLELNSDGSEQTARVYGVVTEIAPDEFPDVLSGHYYVDGWEQGSPKQYLQFVVIVWEADNAPAEVAAPNHQIRYVLAGVESQPIEIANARFVMVGTGEPEHGRWVRFEQNIRQDFEELWGAVPEGFSRLRVLFEVRWDDRTPDDGRAAADVFYDDLYIGPAQGSP